MDASMTKAVGDAVTEITGAFGSITNWWVIGVAVAIFGASIAIGVVAKLLGKRRGRKGK